MTPITDLTDAEAKGLKLALSHLIDEGDLEAAISLLETSIQFIETETGGIRAFLFQVLFADACGQLTSTPISRLH
ncbi:hypothetical protein NIT7321_03152 [Phaeobacter italicus]|uniref:Uncharacterized protein n=1 Tax=Phaeobacter italicus TaxID=481446 RepID=A0A0H5D6G5_9RHOB|nr:hypothetical protein [Phaeobacter italicus]CRL12278.1 hypothetical protein NIT7321_03152 [Phaeobacter italicus]